jgi:hypothetical protein
MRMYHQNIPKKKIVKISYIVFGHMEPHNGGLLPVLGAGAIRA